MPRAKPAGDTRKPVQLGEKLFAALCFSCWQHERDRRHTIADRSEPDVSGTADMHLADISDILTLGDVSRERDPMRRRRVHLAELPRDDGS